MRSSPGGELLEAVSGSPGIIADPMMRGTFAEFAAAIVEIADILDRSEIAAEDCLALECDNSVPSAIALLALLVSGRTFLLLPRPEATADGHKGAAVSESFCRFRLRAGRREEVQGGIDIASANISICITRDCGWRTRLPAGPARLFLRTSGTTGSAKLVRHRHDRLLRAARNAHRRLGLSPADRIAVPVPLAHMYGLGAAFIPAVLTSASVDLQPNSNVLRYLARERQFDPTVAFLTPTFGDAVERIRKRRREYRLTVMAGDRLTTELFDRYERMHGRLVNLYGSTELGVIAAGDPEDPAERRRNLIGRLLPGVSLWGGPDEPSAAGDPAVPYPLWFDHDFGFECYVDLDGREVREPDGSLTSGARFRSGDFGRLVGGYLDVVGRDDDRVNRDGLLLACGEVAAALRAIDGIEQVAVLAGGASRRGRALIAFCVPAAGSRWAPGSLRKACFGILPARAVPDQILILAEMPHLANGKIDRAELRRRHATAVDPDDAAT